MPDVGSDGDSWSVLVPVKRLELAKTRLAVDEATRRALALAMALDTVAAAVTATSVAEVVVITDDSTAAAAVAGVGARVVADVPDAGLNPALAYGATAARMPHVAALSSDLPALRPADLDAVLVLAHAHRSAVVADSGGTGTTVLTANAVTTFVPSFGEGSLAAHRGAGAVDLSRSAAASVRQDVDTVEELRRAARLGVGARTAALLVGLGLGGDR
jgi:2-phospho-L-lactate guanylyltransferase